MARKSRITKPEPEKAKRRIVRSRKPASPVPAAALPGEEPGISDETIDAVYDEIRGLQREATLQLAIRIGGLIVDRFFRGDLVLARSRSAKSTSLRRLAERFERDGAARGASVATLSRAMAVYALEQAAGVSRMRHLMGGHAYAVLPLRDDEDRRRLLTAAEAEKWTVAKLREEVGTELRRSAREGSRRGRKPALAFERTTNRISALIGKANAFAGLDQVSELKPGRVLEIQQTIGQLRQRLAEIEAALAERNTDGRSPP